MDLSTSLSVALGFVAAKVLGPTFDYGGEWLKSLAEKRISNMNSIFAKTSEKLGEKFNEEGGVSPRIFKHIYNEGSFCEDSLTQEYYAGLLASSRDETSMKDDSLPYLLAVGQMSTKNILFHYMLYYAFVKMAFREESMNFFDARCIQVWTVLFSSETVEQIFLKSADAVKFFALLSDVCSHANKEGLITQYRWGKSPEGVDLPVSEWLQINPSLHGLNLFLKANAAPEGILSAPVEERTAWIDALVYQSNIKQMPTVRFQHK